MPWITDERSEAGDTFLSVIEVIEYFSEMAGMEWRL